MPYSRADLLAATRSDHPEFANVPDNDLFAAIAVDHPDIAKGISELQPPTGPPQSALDKLKSYLPGWGTALQAAGGIVGTAVGGPAGLPIGVAAGEAIHQVGQHAGLLDQDSAPQTSTDAAHRILEPAAVAAGSEMALSGLGALAARAKTALQSGLNAAAGGDEAMAAQKLTAGKALPPNTSRSVLVEKVAPQIASENPNLLQLKQSRFDQKTFQDFQNAGHNVGAAQASLPPDATVSKNKLVEGLDTAIDGYYFKGELEPPTTPNQFFVRDQKKVTFNPDAIKVLTDLRSKINDMPDQIPAKDAIDIRQRLDNIIQQHGGWDKAAGSYEKASLEAHRIAAGTIRDSLSDLSPQLADANQAYGDAADKMAASNLSWKTGARSVGGLTPLQQKAQTLKSVATKAAIGTGIAAGAAGVGAGIYHEATK